MNLLLAALSAILIQPASEVSEPTTLSAATDALARDVKKFLEPQGHREVVLGNIAGPTARAVSAGPGVVELLSHALQREGLIVKARLAPIAIDGRFLFVPVPSDHPDDKLRGASMEAIRIELVIADANGKELTRLAKEVLDEGDQAALDGRSFDAPPTQTRAERDETIRQAQKDGVHTEGAQIRAKAGSPFAIEVVRKGQSIVPLREDGLAFVKVAVDDEYEVKVTNGADFDVAVKLTIDGISMYAFSEAKDDRGRPRYEFLIIPARSSGKIPGWHITNQQADRFKVVPAARSAAAKLGLPTQDMGTITVVFRSAWAEGTQPPAGELLTTSRSGVGTDRGERIGQNLEEVRRHIGRVRAAVSVRYDSKAR